MTWYGTDSARDYSIFVQKFNADGTIALPPAISAAGNATVQSSETGTAYLVSSAITVNTLADITGVADSSWNSVTITTANSTTNLAATGLADGTYKVYTIDAAGNLSAAATNTITVDGVPTQTVGTVDISADTGTSAGDFLTNTAAQTITGTLSGALADSDILYGSVDNGSTWIDITGKVNGTAISWDGATLSGSSAILFKITDATGDDSATTGSQTYVLDTTAPAFSSGASVNFAENGAGTAYNATADGDTGVTYTLGGTDAAKFGINAGTGAVTFNTSPNYEAPTDSGGNNVYDITVTATDAAGNATDRAVAITVTDEDEVAPAFTSATTASFAENGTGTAYDATADSDSGITYTLGGTDVAKFGIVANTGVVTFTTSPNYEAPTDNGGNNVYNITVTATDAAGNATNQAVAITVTNVTNGTGVHANTNGTTGDFNDVIDLGAYGKLIAPVYVDGNWYYYWDRSGDGTSANSGGLNGGLDGTTHDVLDGLFANDINGVANTTVTNTDGLYGTTDIYRYATLNGVRVALPTHGEASVTAGNRPGTAIDNSPAGEANPTYNDLLAIWDGYNGTDTGTGANGTPPGWQPSTYYSATPSPLGHASFDLDWPVSGGGYVNDDYEDHTHYVALQVL